MREVKTQSNTRLNRLGLGLDTVLRAVSPRRAFERAQYRFAYDALDGHRTRKKRSLSGGKADTHLNATSLDQLREIHREYMRNNPLVEGLLLIELDEIIGDVYPKIQARTGDEALNKELEAAWKERMVMQPCDTTGRFNAHQLIGMSYLAYRRDGDAFLSFHQSGIQGIEGDRVGTPLGLNPKTYNVVNGIAFSKKTQRLLGCYVGKPGDNGFYIEPHSYTKYTRDRIHQVFSPQRLSQSRGEPALKAGIAKIDQLDKYIDAELVAASVNACFTMFITNKNQSNIPSPYTYGDYPSGQDSEGNRVEKMEPGTILYGESGQDKAEGVGMNRPGAMFDPFVIRMISFISRPLAIPLMMALGDYSHATYMNTRFGYKGAQKRWRREQQWVVRPMASRIWQWFMDGLVRDGSIKQRDDLYTHSVQLQRWPYVDPYKESMAHKQQLENQTSSRREIIEGEGKDYDEVLVQLKTEKQDFAELQAVNQGDG